MRTIATKRATIFRCAVVLRIALSCAGCGDAPTESDCPAVASSAPAQDAASLR